jgi:hypothetical protein
MARPTTRTTRSRRAPSTSRRSLKRPDGLFVPDNIKARTAECRALLNPQAAVELTPEQQRLQKIADLCQSRFDCHSAQTRELVQLIMQVELPPPLEDSTNAFPFVPGSLIIYNRKTFLIESTDSDGDAVYYSIEDGRLTVGSYIGKHRRCTPCTDAQIDEWVKQAGLIQ